MLEPLDAFSSQLCAAWRESFSTLPQHAGGRQHSALLAVSGGADSMALLHSTASLAARLGARFEVATIDHGARAAAAKETALVEKACAALGLPCHVVRLSLGLGAGFEARARAARYETLESIRRRQNLALTATAHTATDQAETVLMHLLRGSALSGAAGIHRVRGLLVRPMLFAERHEVRAWLRSRRLRWAEDPMNTDESFFRVRVRQRVLPALAKVSDQKAVGRLARFARFAVEDEAYLAAKAAAALARLRVETALDATGLAALEPPVARRVMASYLSERGLELDSVQIEAAVRACSTGVTATLKRDLNLVIRAGAAHLVAAAPRAAGRSQGISKRQAISKRPATKRATNNFTQRTRRK